MRTKSQEYYCMDYRELSNRVKFDSLIEEVSTDMRFDRGAPYTYDGCDISRETSGEVERVLGVPKDEDYY